MKNILILISLVTFTFSATKDEYEKRTNNTAEVVSILPTMTNFQKPMVVIWTNAGIAQTNTQMLFPIPTLEMYLEVLRELKKMRDDIVILKAK